MIFQGDHPVQVKCKRRGETMKNTRKKRQEHTYKGIERDNKQYIAKRKVKNDSRTQDWFQFWLPKLPLIDEDKLFWIMFNK